MAQQLQNITIAAPGFAGLNTQDSPIDLPPVFASVADNCIIDQYGRIGARKGFDLITTDATPLGSSIGIEAIGQYVTDAGVTTVVSAGNNKIFTGTSTLTDVTPGGGYTITTNNWKIKNFNDKLYLFQRGYEPLVYNGTTVVKMSSAAGAAGTPPQANEVLAAFGRLFVADFSADKSTVYWSDLLNGVVWTGGSSGSIDVTTVWPNGYDEIIALASHNGFLIIFGKRSILIYSGADDPSTMVLHDTVNGIGCISRDSVVYTGSDIYFLDYTGVRSLGRTVQEKSAPIGDLSKNVRDVFSSAICNCNNIKCHYSPEDAFYLVNLSASNQIYCFDTRRPLEDGSLRVTLWRGSVESFARMNDGTFYIGLDDGIAEYTGYTDNGTPYNLSYFSHPLAFGASSALKMLKKVNLTIIGAANATGVLNWGYDFTGAYSKQTFQLVGSTAYAEYGISEYNSTAEYSVSVSISKPRINTSGSGSAVTIGVEVPINGSSFSLQELNIHALLGRIV